MTLMIFRRRLCSIEKGLFLALTVVATLSAQQKTPSITTLTGVIYTTTGKPVVAATVIVTSPSTGNQLSAVTRSDGQFVITGVAHGPHTITVQLPGQTPTAPAFVNITDESVALTISDQNTLSVVPILQGKSPRVSNDGEGTTSPTDAGTGGEKLSSQTVSELPLNGRDFSTLLLLAAGTMTDVNGATNFTQQFAVNGQRGVEAVFGMDGADVSDPEMGGSTFTNFNVDAIQELQSSSGWMPAEIGRGAAGFTNIVTRSGKSGFHGSFFEFIRNSAFDARNYFDHPSIAEPGRIPPFRRNEFGFTNGGPIVLPNLYDGRGRTFYFVQYQGFRQVLGTTQVLAVPTAAERAGQDVVAYPDGSTDTLQIAGSSNSPGINPAIAAVLSRYPLPNNPTGAFGTRTYSAPSNVKTDADQFSIRIDQEAGRQGQLFARFNYDNLTGPTTNPNQTLIDPSFGVQYVDRQRNAVLTYTRTVSPRFLWSSSLSLTRTTPSFPTPNHTDPALKFVDGLFEPFNGAAGSVMSAFGNLFHGQVNFVVTTKRHTVKWGVEARLNRDTTYFGISPNGEYDFGGGTVFSPVFIPSTSGQHDIQVGDPLPDTLSSLLLGYPYAYTIAVAPPYSSDGTHIGPAAINRNNVNGYVQDTWKINENWTLDSGLRYEVYTPISERANRTSSFLDSFPSQAVGQQYLINPRPTYRTNWNGWGPRVQVSWNAPRAVHVHIGGAMTVIPPNIWQDNFLTGSTPYVVYPRVNAAKNGAITYGFQITPDQLPQVYTPQGVNVLASGDPKKVPANTVMDVNRYQQNLATLSPSHQLSLLSLSGVDRRFGNGSLQTWTFGVERAFGGLTADVAYVGTSASRLPRVAYPNAYPGADPSLARFTTFDSSGAATGGFGFESVITATAHSSYHALQTSLSGNLGHGGPALQAGYTWGKSLDDVSGLIGGTGSTGAVVVFSPQNPFDTRSEKGPSNFDVTDALTVSAAQDLHMEHLGPQSEGARLLTKGWQLLSISTISSGSPFTVYSGVQQTGAGTIGADRPDQVERPHLSTAHSSTRRREDYFGLGDNCVPGPCNASFFNIPVGVPGGTGPKAGRFGTLGRNTFRGPAYYDFDFALIKTTPLARQANGAERAALQFRAEFFNLFNIVNMGLPANTISGSGFGVISKTAGTSRQIQFSLKVIY